MDKVVWPRAHPDMETPRPYNIQAGVQNHAPRNRTPRPDNTQLHHTQQEMQRYEQIVTSVTAHCDHHILSDGYPTSVGRAG